MTAETPTLPDSFFESVLAIQDPSLRTRWYMCAIITLSALNYPDVIPQVFQHYEAHVLANLPSDEARRDSLNRLREGLIKSTGIVGAARTGNSMRVLSTCTPEHLLDTRESPRSLESEQVARERGRKFWTNVYARNPNFDPNASVKASPDYAFVVRDVLYARIFSFDGIIDDLTTGYAMVSALYGLDCQNQLQHHMKGMLWNGATREQLVELQELCLGIVDVLGVKQRHGRAPIPTIPQEARRE